jgi:hypothetical protein
MTFLLALVAAAAAAAPTAQTDAPADVGRDSATLRATVDPNGAPTTVRFQYGTSPSYGVESEARTVEGEDPVAVTVPVTGLTPDTSYNVRVVATSAEGTANGANRTFRTQRVPQPPIATTAGVRDVSGQAATLVGRVDPRGEPTQVAFEWGTSTAYGSQTPMVTIPGNRSRAVSARISGLRAGRRYHFRLVATNAAGVARGADRSFVADRRLTGVALSIAPRPAIWGQVVTVNARVRGDAPGGAPVVLERQEWPYTGPYNRVRSRTADASGRARFTVPVWRSIRLRIRARNVLGEHVEVLARPKVGIRLGREGSRVRAAGSVWPALEGARVSLQRRSASGRWTPVARGDVLPAAAGRSRYALTAPAPRRGARWRVVVVPRADGAYVRGVSGEKTTRARR